MEVVTYSWSQSRSFRIPADVVGAAVNEIVEAEGACAPSRLVDVARPDDSPLHSLFTWDDVRAAQNWRVHEARHVINSLQISVQGKDGMVTAPAFVSVGHTAKTAEYAQGYRPVSVVVQTPELRSEALQAALRDARALRRRYEAIKELSPVWDLIDQIAA